MDMEKAPGVESHGDVNAAYSPDLTASASAFAVICPVLAAIRIFGRMKLRQELGNDDLVIITAVVCFHSPRPFSA